MSKKSNTRDKGKVTKKVVNNKSKSVNKVVGAKSVLERGSKSVVSNKKVSGTVKVKPSLKRDTSKRKVKVSIGSKLSRDAVEVVYNESESLVEQVDLAIGEEDIDEEFIEGIEDVFKDALQSSGFLSSSFDGFDGGRAERLTKATGVDAQTAFHMKNTELFRKRDEIKSELIEIERLEEERKGRLSNTLRDRRRRLTLDMDTVTWDIFEFNKGLVRSYVKKFTSNTSVEDSEDFMSAGSVGLMRAIDSFRVDQGRFGHWAYKPIQREVLRAVRDADYENMNPGDFEKRPDILRAQKELVTESGKEDFQPSLEAVALRAGVTLKQADRVLNAPKLDSLHAPVGDEGDATVGDLIPSGAADLSDSVVSKLEVEALEAFGLSCLDRRELFVLARRFGLDCEPEQRLSAIGDMLGLSREAVRQVESKALAKLMHPTTLRKIARAGRA